MSLLRVDGLTVRYGSGRRALTAVDGVSLDVPEDAVVGLVGESGCGKSTLARALVGLVPVSGGRVVLDGVEIDRRRPNRDVQLVFQDPYAALDPRLTVGATIREALTARHRRGRAEVAEETVRLLELVGLDAELAPSRPRQLSGGQRQRVALVRALAAEPRLLVADEITSALDASLRGAVLNLVADLRVRLRLAVLFISHDLAAVRHVSDVVAVMHHGRIVEVAPTDELIGAPRHPYTRELLAATPRLDGPPDATSDATLEDDPVPPADPPADEPDAPPTGCRFRPRCPVGPLVHPDREICVREDPATTAATRPHRAACHFAGPPAR